MMEDQKLEKLMELNIRTYQAWTIWEEFQSVNALYIILDYAKLRAEILGLNYPKE